MYSQRLQELFHSRAHAGNLPDATHFGQAGTPGQGPYMRLWLKVDNNVVAAARFKTYGCPAAIAVGEALCAYLESRSLAEITPPTAEEVTAWVDGVPEGKEHCPPLASEAFRTLRPV